MRVAVFLPNVINLSVLRLTECHSCQEPKCNNFASFLSEPFLAPYPLSIGTVPGTLSAFWHLIRFPSFLSEPFLAPYPLSGTLSAFPSLGDTIGSSSIRPHRLGTEAVDHPGVGKPGLQPAVTMETARSPKFP